MRNSHSCHSMDHHFYSSSAWWHNVTCSRDPPAAKFMILQRCHHPFQCTETDIQIHRQFSSCNPPICTNKQTKSFFILWCDWCAWPSGTCRCHQPTTSLCSYPLFGFLKHSAGVDECQQVPFFLHGWIQLYAVASYTLTCQMPCDRLSFCCTAIKCNGILMEGSASIPISLTSASDIWAIVIKQETLLFVMP